MKSKFNRLKTFAQTHPDEITIGVGVILVTGLVAAMVLYPEAFEVEAVEEPIEKTIVEVHHYYHTEA